MSALLAKASDHLAAGETEPARLLVQEGLRRWPEAGQLHLLNARIFEAEGQEDLATTTFREATMVLRQQVDLFAESPELALALAQASIKCGETEVASNALALAKQRGAGEASAAPIELSIAWAAGDWPAMRSAAERVIAARVSPTVDDFLALSTACRNLNDLDAAASAAELACECNPVLPAALMTAALIARERGEGEAALSHFRALAQRAPENPRWAIEIVWLLILLGRIAEATNELDSALARVPMDAGLWQVAVEYAFRSPQDANSAGAKVGNGEEISRLSERAPGSSELLRATVIDEKLSDVIVAPAADTQTVVLVFTGASDQVSMPLAIFDRYLAALGVTAIYLKDFDRLLYLDGIRSLGSNYDATIAAFRQIKSRLAARRLCTVGSSDGGFAAIRYGVALGADRILSFDGPTHWAPQFDAFAFLTKRLAKKFSEREIDLKEFIESQRSSSKITLFYGQGSHRDKMHAQYLSSSAGVHLHPVMGVNDHNVLRWLALNETLLAMLRELLAITA
jgi:tetratricopeptide (TPR) repeat protein